MKERAISFSELMAPPVYYGTKTETRRMGPKWANEKPDEFQEPYLEADGSTWRFKDFFGKFACPHGKIGDRLWVRESYYDFGFWKPQLGVKTPTGKQKYKFVPSFDIEDPGVIRYFNNPPAEILFGIKYAEGWYKRLARFMPRTASRMLLEITDIKLERLHDLRERMQDAVAEGIEVLDMPHLPSHVIPYRDYLNQTNYFQNPFNSFRSLWIKINSEESWNSNPWVWVIKFIKV